MGNDRARTGRTVGASPGGKARASVFGTATARSRDGASLQDVPGILGAIESVIDAGDAIILARTSDGGAYAITLLSNGGRERVYCATQGELDGAFGSISNAYARD